MRPMVLLIDDDANARGVAGRHFGSLGWDAAGAATDGWRDVGRDAALVLCAANGPRPAPAIDILRAHPAIGEAPVAAWVASLRPGELEKTGYDDVLDRSADLSAMTALAQRWRPDDPSATLDRLEAALGREEIEAMTGRLRDQLIAALGALSTIDHPDEAHRIAGIAGMLGFDELGAAWLAVSRGADGAGTAARIATRRALSALGRRCTGVSRSAAHP